MLFGSLSLSKDLEKKLPSDKNLLLDRHLGELGSLGVNGGTLCGVDGTPFVDRVTDDVDDATQCFLSNRDSDGGASVKNLTVKLSYF